MEVGGVCSKQSFLERFSRRAGGNRANTAGGSFVYPPSGDVCPKRIERSKEHIPRFGGEALGQVSLPLFLRRRERESIPPHLLWRRVVFLRLCDLLIRRPRARLLRCRAWLLQHRFGLVAAKPSRCRAALSPAAVPDVVVTRTLHSRRRRLAVNVGVVAPVFAGARRARYSALYRDLPLGIHLGFLVGVVARDVARCQAIAVPTVHSPRSACL
ncbi:hypothetical protein KSP40_PGU021080 [Platanthera guangdongensis]|uniref:Uncharacterized protein n=1 Tax=Platanthera guangdongensis TaxID=2320717 RepID=A0ABR2LTC7_9ASPA